MTVHELRQMLKTRPANARVYFSCPDSSLASDDLTVARPVVELQTIIDGVPLTLDGEGKPELVVVLHDGRSKGFRCLGNFLIEEKAE